MTGDEFRDLVADLLASAGFRIQVEREISGKRVDTIAEAQLMGRTRLYAIECKCYANTVGIGDITEELSQYSILLNSQLNMIEEVWFVSFSGFTNAAINHSKAIKHLELLSFREFQSRLLDIRPYIQMLVDNYATNELSEIYIPLRTLTKTPLEDELNKWISNTESNALAIVAGYGRGKTTFSQRLAAKLAEKALDNPAERTPILIRLSDIAHQVKMSGLIAGTVADNTLVSRFSYNFFKKLNHSGRFIIILDGFDEMKFGLNFDEFNQIFSQIYELITGDSKVLILGRPSAFLSESEELAVLSGSQADQYSEKKDLKFEGFSLLSIDMFSDDEAKTFVRNYAKKASHTRATSSVKPASINEQVDKWLNLVDAEIIRRPVHARMLGEIVASGNLDPIPMNHYTLYNYFVDSSIKRELQKDGRDRRISLEARREFIGRLAWWSWTSLKRTSFAAADIEEKIFDAALKGLKVQKDVAKRELIISSILERKNASDPKLSFQHRSMQEFLVADMALKWKLPNAIILPLSRGLTPELAAFFIDSRHKDTLQEAFDQFNGGAQTRFHIQFLRLFLVADKAGLLRQPPPIKNDEPYTILYNLLRLIGTISWRDWGEEILKFALGQIQISKPRQSSLMLQMLTAYLVNQDRSVGKYLVEPILRGYSKITNFDLVSSEMRRPGVSLRNAKILSPPSRALFMSARYVKSPENGTEKIRFNFLTTLHYMRKFGSFGAYID